MQGVSVPTVYAGAVFVQTNKIVAVRWREGIVGSEGLSRDGACWHARVRYGLRFHQCVQLHYVSEPMYGDTKICPIETDNMVT